MELEVESPGWVRDESGAWRRETIHSNCIVCLFAALALAGAAVADPIVHSVVTNGVEVRWFEDWMKTPDGVRLYTYGMLPKDGTKCPTIVARNPYVDESRIGYGFAEYYSQALRRGYVMVVQHVRGAGISEGKRIPYEVERADGLALLDYVRRQPWYNGEIFLSGGSYLASVHWSYLDANPPDVKGAFLTVQDVNRYNVCYRNGFFKGEGLHGSWFRREYCKNDHNLSRNAKASFADFPLMDFSKNCWGGPVPALDNAISHPRPDDPFWSSREIGSGAEYRNALLKSTMPILLKTAFYDIYTEGVFDMWRETPPARRANCALLVDAYNHGGQLSAEMKGTLGEFPKGSRADEHVEDLDWFDAIRAKKPCAGAPAGRTRYYALWENAWQEGESLADGPRKLALRLGTGERSYTYDPKKPLPEFPGSGGICFGGMKFQKEPNAREDVLSFVLPPMTEQVDVRGRMTASLAVASDCEDTCFYARLSVRKSDGRWYLLRDDITSLGFQLGRYEPNAKVCLKFRFADHAFRLAKGDVLRLDVSSASSQFAPHANVAGEQFRVKTPRVAHNRVYAAESEIVLPAR